MNNQVRNKRLSPPLMFAFRAAHAEKDARKTLDLRDEQGERIIAARRVSAASVLADSVS